MLRDSVGMWPFRNSKTARRENVVRFVLDAATLAFGRYLAGGRLVRAMQLDAFVLGYVLARLRGLAAYASADARLPDEAAALSELALSTFFGHDACNLALQAESAAAGAERERYLAGASDGQAQCDYLFGARDVREHPLYPAASQRERSAAAAMPGNTFNGSAAAIAHHLEYFTFEAYFDREHPLTAPAHVCPSVA